MKTVALSLLVVLTLVGAAAAQEKTLDSPPAAELKTTKQRASYGFGMQIGRNLKAGGVSVEEQAFMAGLRDALVGNKAKLSDQDIQLAISALFKEIAAANKKEGDDFLAANKTKEGVVVLPSGLQYKILRKGDGPKPKPTDVVRVNYEGTFVNGMVFDSSYQRNEPAEFPLNQVIKGWTEGLQQMQVGSKHQLFVPSHLAYGEEGRPGIPANSMLIFVVELLAIVPQK